MNIAHAYYKLSVMDSAFNNYNKLSTANDNKLRSIANQQLGVIANKRNKKQAALNFFKEALKADPANEDARYNYELLKKQSDQQQQKKQDNDQQNDQDNKSSQNQQNKENQQKENKDQEKDESEKRGNGEPEKKERQKDESEKRGTGEPEKKEQQERPAPMMDQQKLQEMKISPEKAKMILDAMRNSEIQYLQQMQKKPTKRRESNKPDW